MRFYNKLTRLKHVAILCNTDGIFNDNTYDYDNIGLPFLAKLGRAVYEHELKRVRKGKPDMERFRASLR